MMVDALTPTDDPPGPAETSWRSRAGLLRRSLAANGLDLVALANAVRGIGPFVREQRRFRAGLASSAGAATGTQRRVPPATTTSARTCGWHASCTTQRRRATSTWAAASTASSRTC
jgi:hypothetical protein